MDQQFSFHHLLIVCSFSHYIIHMFFASMLGKKPDTIQHGYKNSNNSSALELVEYRDDYLFVGTTEVFPLKIMLKLLPDPELVP